MSVGSINFGGHRPPLQQSSIYAASHYKIDIFLNLALRFARLVI